MQLSERWGASRLRTRISARSFFASMALVALISTILLIMVGSIVRVTGYGLGCPDWPLCYGQAIPPLLTSAWVEFTHRLFGAVVVAQVAGLIALAWRYYRFEKWIFRTAIAAGFALALQVLLGGIHVLYELPRWTGWIHTAVAMSIAGLLALWVGLSHPSLRMGEQPAARPALQRLGWWTAVIAGATYLLLLTGSLVTRTGASLVCPTFPACGLDPVREALRPLVTIQMLHRWSAFIVGLSICLLLWYLMRTIRQEILVGRFALALVGLVVVQFGLGMANVWLHIPMWSRVLHLGTAATIWSVLVILSASLYRSAGSAKAAES